MGTERSIDEWIAWRSALDPAPLTRSPEEANELEAYHARLAQVREPLFHSNITDRLPDDHPLAWQSLHCTICTEYVHVGNENMQEWFETNTGPYCATCWFEAYEADQVGGDLRLGLG